ncbi:MAG: 23S rRNA (uracil(1939)-C(5))-methyltransferase RlmD [Bacteroidota bacterium]
MKRGEEVTLLLEDFASEGKSVARLEGLVFFVEGGVPGDRVRAEVRKVKKQHAEAELRSVLDPSPLRTEPRCRHFGLCGGCRWQHVAYPHQLAFKAQQVRDALERIGGFRGVEVHPALGSPDSYYYRNKMEFSFGERWLTEEEMAAGGADRFGLGLHRARRFDRVLDIRECHLQRDPASALLNEVRDFCRERSLEVFSTRTQRGYLRHLVIRASRNTPDLMVNLVTSAHDPPVLGALVQRLVGKFPELSTVVNNVTTRKSQVALGEEERVYYGSGFITERLGARTYRISANSFFQTNTLQAERLYDRVREMARPHAGDLLYDLYAGTGTIALHLAGDVREVVGVESSEAAVEDARGNARMNGVENCRFAAGDLKEWLSGPGPRTAGPPDVVIVDPPRSGMHPKAAGMLAALGARRIVYVSCNPATQARDLKIICGGGEYAVAEVQPVDMFPHTFHIESVAALERRTAALTLRPAPDILKQ